MSQKNRNLCFIPFTTFLNDLKKKAINLGRLIYNGEWLWSDTYSKGISGRGVLGQQETSKNQQIT